MANIRLNTFDGRSPQVDPKRLSESDSQTAKNCDFRYGNLRPIDGLTKGDMMGGLRIVDIGGTISWYNRIDDDTVSCTSTAHGLTTGNTITITESINYNGNFTVTVIDTNTFSITATDLWKTNDKAGEWVKDYIVIQDSTGNLTSTAVDGNGASPGDIDADITVETDAAHGLSVGDNVWFDSTMGGVGYYPTVYTITAKTDTTFTFTATYVANADPSDSDWFAGDYVVTGEVGSIYLMNDSWLNLAGDTDFAESFIADNNYRIYYTSESGPRQTDYDLAIQGQSYQWPFEYNRLGIESPPDSIKATASDDTTVLADDTTSLTVAQSVAYVYTYVTGWDEEGPESPASDVIDIEVNQKVTLTGFSLPLVYANNIDYIRLYKTVTGTDGTTEYLQINRKGIITGTTDGTDKVVIASAGHGLVDTTEAPTVLIYGTTSYNGEWTVEVINSDSFYILDDQGVYIDWTSGTEEGEWVQTSDITLTDAVTYGVIDRNDPEDAGIQLSTEDFDPPPTDLQDIRLFSNNIYAGFNGDNELCLSEPGYPYAWPIKYRIPVAYSIIAVSGYLSTLLVLTDEQPFLVVGTDPSTMTLYPMPYKKPCINNTGVVSTPNGVLYPTYDGLYRVTSSSGDLVTRRVIDRITWENYPLTDIYAAYFDGKYIAFFKNTNTGFYLDFEAQNLRLVDIEFPVDFRFKNFHNDGQDLYLLSTDNYLYQWGDDPDTPLTYTWKSKIFQFLSATNFSIARIINDGTNDLTFNLYVDGSSTAFHYENVSGDDLFRLPAGTRAKEFEIEVTGTSHVDLIEIANTIEELE